MEKILGTIIQNNLKWDSNTYRIVKKSYARMQLLWKLSEFGASSNELKTIYIAYIRSILEQSCVVWNHSLTNQNTSDLERVQKSACKLILKNKYQSYEKSLDILNLETLKDRRDSLCLAFAKSSDKNSTIKFEVSNKRHNMTTRNTPKYKVTHCNTDRLLKSAIPQFQRLLNTQS